MPTPEPAPEVPSTPITGRLANFEANDWSEVDNNGPSATSNASIAPTSERAYEGSKALKISFNGTAGNVFARMWYQVNWQKGSDVWYGAAFYVPDPSKLAYTDMIRWDNYVTYGSAAGETGGVLASNGRIYVQKRNYDGSESAHVTSDVAIPAGRWFWLEVHQRLSNVAGEALSEMYIDGRKVAESTAPNSRGRVVNEVRYGYVYNWDQGGASTMYMDRVSISDRARGPLG